MRGKIILSALFTFVFAAVSFGQAQANRVLFSNLPDASGGELVSVTFTGLENPNLRIFESLVPASSNEECHSSTAFPNPRVLSPKVAKIVVDPTTGAGTFQWLTHLDRQLVCRVVRVGETVDTADLTIWQSRYGSSGVAESGNDARQVSPGPIVYTYEVRNTGSAIAGSSGKE